MTIDADALRKIALGFPRALEKPHFDRASYRVDVARGKIFCTVAPDRMTANVFLTVDEQALLIEAEPDIFSKVPNKWGEKGATTICLSACDAATLKSALTFSWRGAAPPKIHSELGDA